jgi:hypothetical protein
MMRSTTVARTLVLSVIVCVAGVLPAAAQKTPAEVLQDYAAGAPLKALATSNNGPMGFATGRSATTIDQARNLALGNCAAAGGLNCRVTQSRAR